MICINYVSLCEHSNASLQVNDKYKVRSVCVHKPGIQQIQNLDKYIFMHTCVI